MKETIRRLVLISLVAVFVAGISACSKPKAELSVSKTQIKQGESVSVNWKTQNAKEVLLNGQKVSKTGSQAFQPTQSTTYELLGKSGSKQAKDSKTVTVEVLAAAPTITFTSDKGVISPGEKATLRWTSQRADKVEIPGLGSFGPSGETAVSPNQSTTYTATAKGPGGDASASARVTVNEKSATNLPNSADRYSEEINTIFKQNVKSVYFDFDKSDLSGDAKSRLDRNASFLLQQQYRNVYFRVEGNCDPRGSEEYNLALGDKRANEAKTYLVSKGVDPSRMDVISNGKRNANGTAEGSPEPGPSWSHDRRADFIYVRGGELRPTPAQ